MSPYWGSGSRPDTDTVGGCSAGAEAKPCVNAASSLRVAVRPLARAATVGANGNSPATTTLRNLTPPPDHPNTGRATKSRSERRPARRRSSPRRAGARAQDDERLGADDLGAPAAALADAVDDSLEVIDVVDPQAHERVGVAGDRERLDQLREVIERVVDVSDLGSRGKAELGERLELAAELRVVEDRGVAADVAGGLQPVDAALGGGGGKVYEPADLAGRAPGVPNEQVEDAVIKRVEAMRCHEKIVTSSGPLAQRFVVDAHRSAQCCGQSQYRPGTMVA